MQGPEIPHPEACGETGCASMTMPRRQRRLGERHAKTHSSRGPSRKRFCNCGQAGRVMTNAEPGLPRRRPLMAGISALGTTPWVDFAGTGRDRWPGRRRKPPSGGSDLCTAPAPGPKPPEEGAGLRVGSGWWQPGSNGDWSPTWHTKCAKLAAFSGRGIFCRAAGDLFGANPSACHSWPLSPAPEASVLPPRPQAVLLPGLATCLVTHTTPPTSRVSSLLSRPRAAGHPYPGPRTIFVPPSCWAPPGGPARRHLQPDPVLSVIAGPAQPGGPSGLTG